MMYVASAVMFTVGATYAAVPLYRIFCQETGYGGTTQKGHDKSKVGEMKVTIILMWIFIANLGRGHDIWPGLLPRFDKFFFYEFFRKRK